MNRVIYFITLCLFFSLASGAQQAPDSSGVITTDTVSRLPVSNQNWTLPPGSSLTIEQLTRLVLQHHPYFGFSAQPEVFHSPLHVVKGKEWLFYLMVMMLLLFAFLRNAFPKYLGDLFRLFFRTTLKQRQIREQLMQTPLPSLLMNCFFIISAGLYITFLVEHYALNPLGGFWILLLYSMAGLSAAYFIKFMGLKLSGWLFNMPDAANSYIFIVFVVNKMLGILLLPFLVLLAFSTGVVYTAGLTLSWLLVGGLLLYRFILTYAAVRNEVKVNPFHFFLYLCAFEIAPLLLIYKGLLLFFARSA